MSPLSPQTIFHWLPGVWRLTREATGLATMEGKASISLIGPREGPTEAEYYESVQVRLENKLSLHGEQRYVFREHPAGFAVHFHPSSIDAGKLFHQLEFSVQEDGWLRAEAEYACPPDHYRSEYIIRSHDCFMIRHKVDGPRKAYVLQTHYRRMIVS